MTEETYVTAFTTPDFYNHGNGDEDRTFDDTAFSYTTFDAPNAPAIDAPVINTPLLIAIIITKQELQNIDDIIGQVEGKLRLREEGEVNVGRADCLGKTSTKII